MEHRSKAAADHAVEEAREGCRNGARTMRIMQAIDPEGQLQVMDRLSPRRAVSALIRAELRLDRVVDRWDFAPLSRRVQASA